MSKEENKIRDIQDKIKEIETDIENFIKLSHEMSIDCDTTVGILREVVDNVHDYNGNPSAIQEMMTEKLSIDDVIAIKNYNKQNK